MEVKTREHLSRLQKIIREDGVLAALDFDFQITRTRNKTFNKIFRGIDYLKKPGISWYGSGGLREYTSKYYNATYSDFGIVELNLK